MAKSKFFRVAVAGATADGRTIESQQLVEMAASYNPHTYAARVNMEHIRGITAEKPFKAYGDVTALKAEEIDFPIDGKTEKRMALFAQIEPTADLIAINKDKQKRFTSIEINPNFAATGKAYLMGLAVTDSPASLGTEMLEFVAGQRAKGTDPFASRRLSPDNLFVESIETAIEFEEDGGDENKALFSGLRRLFESFAAPSTPPVPVTLPAAVTPPAPANDAMTAFVTQMQAFTTGIETAINGVGGKVTALSDRLGKVETVIESTPNSNHTARPPASGQKNFAATDC